MESLLRHILLGTPDDLGLMGQPASGDPPRYVRLVFYDYEFTTPDERRDTGNWWKRRQTRSARPISLSDFR